jgi:hypothetical protein
LPALGETISHDATTNPNRTKLTNERRGEERRGEERRLFSETHKTPPKEKCPDPGSTGRKAGSRMTESGANARHGGVPNPAFAVALFPCHFSICPYF